MLPFVRRGRASHQSHPGGPGISGHREFLVRAGDLSCMSRKKSNRTIGQASPASKPRPSPEEAISVLPGQMLPVNTQSEGEDALSKPMEDGDRGGNASESDAVPFYPGSTRGVSAGLYIVATPIGNLGDITLRAVDILRRADRIACEDTRHSRKLLSGLGIPGAERLFAYHEHNADKVRPRIMEAIRGGDSVALISDAGTPLISDPGYRLVTDCRAEGLPVTGLPGPSSPILALSMAGLPTDRFLFAGFPPRGQGERETAFRELAPIPACLVFLESPGRIARTVAELAEIMGGRMGAVCRELTKLHEEVIRAPLPELAEILAARESIKGEIVLLVGPPDADSEQNEDGLTPEERLDQALRQALASLSLRDAAAMVSEALKLKKRDVYKRALALSEELAAEKDAE